MSLALLQSYSSAEEDDENDHLQFQNSSDDEEENDDVSRNNRSVGNKPLFDFSKPSPLASGAGSSLPSALDAFSEVSGPPQFLNNCIEKPDSAARDDGHRWRGRRNRKERKDLPAGAVLESKAHLVGIHERVRSDIGGNSAPTSSDQAHGSLSTTQGVKRVATASNPNAEDAAELLRMCLQCGIPKTYSSARGMVCPVCGDRPPADTDKEAAKKKGSAIKDKEKSKRMKGQSSHATWKSETEMQLRQQFD